MKELEEKILKEGQALPGDILKVDSFLNHQIDVGFSVSMAKEFKRLFDEKVDKVLTIEASGIAIAALTAAEYGGVPLVFAKKSRTSNLGGDGVYEAGLHSYTHNEDLSIRVNKKYLNKGEKVLLIDDFLANGEAFAALIEVCRQAGCEIVGCGSVITKTYQTGEKRIKDMGIRVESLARIASMDENGVKFA